MNVYFASDHAGYELKEKLIPYIGKAGYVVEDYGAFEMNEEDDYPDFIMPCAERVLREPGSFGIIIGGSGQGEAMVANRMPGIRAAVYYGGNPAIVELARTHNNANILSLGSRFLSFEDAAAATLAFLSTEFLAEARHIRRIGKY